MKSKEEVIKDAYESLGLFVGLANENGWKPVDLIPIEKLKLFNIKSGLARPKSLQGISNNNGWISINSEKDLPSEKNHNDTFYIYDDVNVTTAWYNHYDKCFYLSVSHKAKTTHYQPIVKPNPPLHK